MVEGLLTVICSFSVIVCFMCCITWFGALWNSAIPDLMSELRSVVVHIDHIDHNVYRVFYLVAIKVHCMSSQLEKNKNKACLFKWTTNKVYCDKLDATLG